MEISRIAPMQENLLQTNSTTGNPMQAMDAPYGANLSADEMAFQSSLASAAKGAGATEGISEVAKAVFEPLDSLNKEAADLADFAKTALESENTLTPGEMISLTVKSQQFMFHSQLTANIANRTAEGLQQLFRQQS